MKRILPVLIMVLLLTVSLTVPGFAAAELDLTDDGDQVASTEDEEIVLGEEEDGIVDGSSGMNTLMDGFERVTMLLERVWSLLLSNPLLSLFLAASLVAVGVRAFRKLKGAAKA